MDFLNIAKQRYSVRSYKKKTVEEEKLHKILEAAHAAPTAANLQPVRLIVVQSEEGLAKILLVRRLPLSFVQTTKKRGCVPLIRSRPVTLTRPS